MPSANETRPGFLQGARHALPVAAAITPFGLLFGAVAVQHGLSITEAVMMSAMLFAGASQLVGLNLFGSTVPAWLIVLSIFAVNFRHILYSASLGPKLAHWTMPQRLFGWFFLTDPQYAETERMAGRRTVPFSWYIGLALTIYFCWLAQSYLGARFGRLIKDPQALGFDFILPLYFFAMLCDFRARKPFWPIVLASAAGSIVAIQTVGSPWHVSIGALCGIAAAVIMASPQPPEPMLAPDQGEQAPAP